MKTVIRLGFAALITLATVSCRKENNDPEIPLPPPQQVEANMTSKIYPFTNQPAEIQFGTQASVFKTDDIVTVYVPYGVYNDNIVSSELQLRDEGTGDILATLPLSKETDAAAAGLTVPQDLRYVPFMFVTFSVNSSFSGKNVSFKSTITGKKTTSSDSLANAFAVEL